MSGSRPRRSVAEARKIKPRGRQPRARVTEHRQKVLAQLKAKEVKKESNFLCPLPFNNTLPDITSDPKFLPYPFEADRLYKCNVQGSTLEHQYRYELHAETDCGVPITIIDPQEYKPSSRKRKLHPVDEALCSEAYAKAVEPGKAVDPLKVKADHTWLLSASYIANDLTDAVYKHKGTLEMKHKLQRERTERVEQELTRTTKRQRIEASFAATGDTATIKHKTRQVEIAELWSVLPDPMRYSNDYVQVSFDSNPADNYERSKAAMPELTLEEQRERLARALIRCPDPEPGEPILGWLLLEDTAEEKDASTPEGAAPMRVVREYNVEPQNDGDEDTAAYAFNWDESTAAVYYSRIASKVHLNRVVGGITATRRHRDVHMGRRDELQSETKRRLERRLEIDYDDVDAARADLDERYPDEAEEDSTGAGEASAGAADSDDEAAGAVAEAGGAAAREDAGEASPTGGATPVGDQSPVAEAEGGVFDAADSDDDDDDDDGE